MSSARTDVSSSRMSNHFITEARTMSNEQRLQRLRDAVLRVGRHAVEYGNGITPDARTITLNTYRPAHATPAS